MDIFQDKSGKLVVTYEATMGFSVAFGPEPWILPNIQYDNYAAAFNWRGCQRFSKTNIQEPRSLKPQIL